MAPNLGEEDTIDRILNNPKDVSWETFKALGIDPSALIPKRQHYDSYEYYRSRKSPVHSYTGVSSMWRSGKPSMLAKYRSYYTHRSDTTDTLSSVLQTQPHPQDSDTKDDELIVFETEVIDLATYSENLRREPVELSEPEVKTEPKLADTVENALQLLNTFNLEEAETMFLRVYKNLEDSSEDTSKPTVQMLMGLAEVFLRKSRLTRGNPMERQWLQAHAVALLQHVGEVCSEKLQSEANNQTFSWFHEQQESASRKLKPAEENFVKSLYMYLKSDKDSLQRQMFFSLSAPTTPTGDFSFPLSSTPLQHVFPGMQFQRNASLEHLTSGEDAFPGGLQWVAKFQEYCQDRLQNSDTSAIVEQLFSINNDIADLLNKDCKKDLKAETKIEDTGPLLVSDINNTGEDAESRTDEPGNPLMVSPLPDKAIKSALAKLINKLAEKLVSEGDYHNGEALYQQSLGIVEGIRDGTKGMLVLHAQTVKSLGMIRIKLGQVNEGLQFLQQALQSFRDIGDEASNGDIAVALIEIGDSHTMEKWDEESIFDHVVDVIRDAFDKETLEDGPLTNRVQVEEECCENIEFPKCMSESYVESIEKAILCYEEAIGILENLQGSKKFNSSAYARAITRLGDSHFIQQQYDDALFCYEKAQTIFRSTSGRKSLIQHSHVMCMLGTTSFMLHLYPKATMVFECAYRMLKHAFRGDNPYKMGLLLSLLGLATYKLQHYHKCIPWCFRAFEIYNELFKDDLTNMPKQKLWITCQTLYILGNSYNVLNLHEKAIHYLTLGRSIMKLASNTDKRQYMRVLQVLGDCYFAQYDYKTALSFYNEALQDFEGEVLQLIKVHHNIAELNQSSDDKGFHNQLLSRSADAHLCMKEYKDAFGFLEQVSSIQDNLEDDIKGDLVTTLHQLGNMHSMAGDADQAIQSYKDCVEIYQEINGELGPEMSIILGKLATMCYVKSCTCPEADGELEMTIAAEQNFQDAIALENNPSVLVKYSTFLYSQGNYDDAVMYLQDALKVIPENQIIGYSGLEKVTLPEVLQDEVDYQEEVGLPARSLIHYLLLISHKALGEMKKAEDSLLLLMKDVLKGNNPIMYSLVGYALMDMSLFKDAAEFFAIAFHMKEDYHLATDNYCTCIGIMVLQTLQKSFETIYFNRNQLCSSGQ